MNQSFHRRLARLEQSKHTPVYPAIVEVPCDPDEDLEEVAERLGLIPPTPCILVPPEMTVEEWCARFGRISHQTTA